MFMTDPMLYIHVPFCRRKCRYCAFYSEATGNAPFPEKIYLDTLCAEMKACADVVGGRIRISTVFVGGGTPSLLSAAGLQRMFAAVRKYFLLAEDVEITLEGNPETLADMDKLRVLHESGVNRLSMGVQSMQNDELAALGRVHTRADVARGMQLARAAGFSNIGLDLIWGLPGQTADMWKSTLVAALKLEPEHVSAYGLTVELGTALAADIASGRMLLPDEDEQAVLYELGAEILDAHGYRQYEISNFCRPGYACRHNQGYWNGVDYFGTGPSAVSTLYSKRWTNPAELQSWIRQVQCEQRPVPELLTPEIRAEEYVMLHLRMAEGLDIEACRRETGHDLLEEQAGFIQGLCAAGLAVSGDGRLRLTRRGMLVSNSVISKLLDWE